INTSPHHPTKSIIFVPMLEPKNWYVFYTKSRQEKKVRDLLLRDGYEVFLPMQKVMRQWSDRKKRVEVPLFNSYIFVKDYPHKIADILRVPGMAWNIRHNGKPAILREYEFELIQRFITTGYFLETSGNVESFQVGDRAKIIDGPLAGLSGVLTGEDKNQRFNILLEGIQQVIQVQLPASLLTRVD
ncbi:MAG TPA: UpxY family transcription antiterminator, partial [Chryseosolibacter sp.]|nr:UpxY family transcription antiterminator [Chryseosolibacter sp.]